MALLTWSTSFQGSALQRLVFALLLNAIPALVVTLGMKENLSGLRLLQVGVAVPARLCKKERREKRQQRTVMVSWHYEFEYLNQEGATCRHTLESQEYRLYEVEDEEQETLLYDPGTPGSAVLFDRFHGRLKWAAGGNLQAARWWQPAFVCLPLLTFLTSMAHWFQRFFQA